MKILSSKATDSATVGFLLYLGFTDPKVTSSTNNRIALTYELLDQDKLHKQLGNPVPGVNPEFYNYGLSGKVIVNTTAKTVVLLNTAKNPINPRPINTHVPDHINPEYRPPRIVPQILTPKGVAPLPKTITDNPTDVNFPGSRDNDDSKVPHVPVPQELQTEYIRVRLSNSTNAMLGFMGKMYRYLNQTKFKGELKTPKLALLKNVAASKLRLRGCWYPTQRRLCLSPRLFNADIAFFTEIFLHECCHQAVTELDRVHDRTAQGHGVNWQTWMLKVGLNPRRFDPNDNSTYMSTDEKSDYNTKKKSLADMLKEVVPMNASGLSVGQFKTASLVITGELLNGIVFKKKDYNLAFIPDTFISEGKLSAYMLKPLSKLYTAYNDGKLYNYEASDTVRYIIKKWCG